MTANAFSSVSLDPPLILVCVISPSEGADHISRNGVFAGQHPQPGAGADVAVLRLARPAARPATRSRRSTHRIGASGSPILEGAAAFLDCRLHATHEAGDHLIFIGEVLEIATSEDGDAAGVPRWRVPTAAAAARRLSDRGDYDDAAGRQASPSNSSCSGSEPSSTATVAVRAAKSMWSLSERLVRAGSGLASVSAAWSVGRTRAEMPASSGRRAGSGRPGDASGVGLARRTGSPRPVSRAEA